jgi:hypothetical protein
MRATNLPSSPKGNRNIAAIVAVVNIVYFNVQIERLVIQPKNPGCTNFSSGNELSGATYAIKAARWDG